MPTYSYRCNECGHEFDKRQRFSDDPLRHCPVCDGDVRRVVNSVGIVFKGSGFYVTDNRNGVSSTANGSAPAAEKADAEKPKADAGEKGSSKGADAKKEKGKKKSKSLA